MRGCAGGREIECLGEGNFSVGGGPGVIWPGVIFQGVMWSNFSISV